MSGKYAGLVTELQALQLNVRNSRELTKQAVISKRNAAVLRILGELRAEGVTVPEPVTAVSLIQFLQQQQGGKRKTRRNRKNNKTRKQRKQRKQRN